MNKITYFCDPFKNEECSKKDCFLRGHECKYTTQIQYAMLNRYGLPVPAETDISEPDAEMLEQLARREEGLQ